jgi:hypothetical protein
MPVKKSVFINDKTAAWIATTTTEGGAAPTWSESINTTFRQFSYLLKDALPEFTDAEWEFIANIYETRKAPAHQCPARIAGDIMDSLGIISLDHEPNAELIKRLHGMSQTEQMAVLYFIQIYWLNPGMSFADVKRFLS